MKYQLRCFIFSLSVCIVFTSKAQWTVKNLPLASNEDLYGISFINDTTANITSNTKLVTCTNSFNNFNANSINWVSGGSTVTIVCNQIRDVHFTNANSGLITGQFNLLNDYDVFATGDGGASYGIKYTSNSGGVPRYFMGFDFNGTNALTCGSLGHIIKSTNFGVTWSSISSGTTKDLNDIAYLTTNSVLCVGDGVILRSANSGASWTTDNTYSSDFFKNISLVNNNSIVYTCSDNKIFKSTNSGVSFSEVTTPFNNIKCIKAQNGDTIFIGTSMGIYTSYNSGISWEQFETTKSYWVNKIEIRAGKIYALCKATNLLIANINGLQPKPMAHFTINESQSCGTTTLSLQNASSNNYSSYQWFINNTPTSNNYNYSQTYTTTTGTADEIKLVVTNNGKTDTLKKNYAITIKNIATANLGADIYECYGQQVYLKNTNAPAGQTHNWTPSTIFASTSGTTALTMGIIGTTQIVLNTNNTDNCPNSDTVTIYISADIEEVFHQTHPYTINLCSNAPCNSITSIDFVSEKIGYAFAESREVLKTIDGANTWTTILAGNTSNATNYESGIDFIDANIGYIPGASKKTIDGGTTWTNLGLGFSGSKVHFLNKDTGIVSVRGGNFSLDYGRLYRTTNGGTTFTQVYNYTTHGYFFFHDIKIIDANTFIIAGKGSNPNALIKKTTDAGATWSVIPMPNNGYISDIAMFGTDTIYAVDGANYVYKTTNGGVTWSIYKLFTYPNGSSSSLATSIEMINSQIGYASGNNGRIYKTINGGECWQEVFNTGVGGPMYCIAITPNKNAVFFGGGKVLGDKKPEIFATQYYRDLRINLDSNWCVGNRINTHNYSTGYTNYKWYLDNTMYSSKRDTSFNFNSTGTYLIRIDADSMSVYPVSKTFTVVINPALGSVGPIFGNPYVCTMQTNYSQFSAPTNTNIVHYYWSSSKSNFMSINDTDIDSVVQPKIWPNNSFTQALQLSVYGINSQGCFTTDTAKLTIQTQKNIPTTVPTNITFNKNCVLLDTPLYDINFNPIVYDTLTVSTNTVSSGINYLYNMPNVFNQSSLNNIIKIPIHHDWNTCPNDSFQVKITHGNSCGYSSNSKTKYVKFGLQNYNFTSTPDTVVLPNSDLTLNANLSLGNPLVSYCQTQPYHWYLNNVFLITEYNGSYNNPSVTSADTGYYSIRVKIGCDTVKKTVHVSYATPTQLTENIGINVEVSPNPCNNKLTIINRHNRKTNYELYNNLGQKVEFSDVSFLKEEINVSKYQNGTYFLKLWGDGFSQYKKIIVHH